MARYGSGSKKDITQQAKTFIRSRTALGKPRHGDTSGKIHSIRTSEERSQALSRAVLYMKEEFGISTLKAVTPEMAQAYLNERANIIGQKALDNERLAIQMLDHPKFAMEGTKLDRVRTDAGETRYPNGRSYTDTQIKMIAELQQGHNALATRIAYAAGLRQHELYTLKLASEKPATSDRSWANERFTGREGVIYTVKGKGGLVREVMIPKDLAQSLEARKLQSPIQKTDRKIRYQQHYKIAAGRSWAASFRSASERALGWHRGAHGVRHGYAQERMRELQGNGYPYRKSLAIVSQELGHFRPDITEVYLR